MRLYYTESGTITANSEGVFDFPYLKLTPTSLTEEQQAKYPHLKDAAAFALPAGKDLKPLLKGELVAIGTDADGILQGATLVQSAGALDAFTAKRPPSWPTAPWWRGAMSPSGSGRRPPSRSSWRCSTSSTSRLASAP